MINWLKIISFLIITLTFTLNGYAAEKIILLNVQGFITPATFDYVERGIIQAKKQQAAAIILQLNTDSGLEDSMRKINEAVILSPIPVITYIAPDAANAQNVGMFITYASHLAAMAKGTHIGISTPLSAAEVKKESAYMRSLAQLRGRNADWANLAIQKTLSIPATEAKNLKVIDEVADNLPTLLQKMDGHSALANSVYEPVKTKNATIVPFPPGKHYQIMTWLTTPDINFILMVLALFSLCFECTHPGWLLPGLFGLLGLIVVFFSQHIMPMNTILFFRVSFSPGLVILLIGVGCLMFEATIGSKGILGIAGILAFIFGSNAMFDIHDPHYVLSPLVITIMAIISILFFFMIIRPFNKKKKLQHRSNNKH